MIKLSTNGSQVGGKFDRIEVRGKNATIKDVVVEGDGVALYSNYNCSGLVVEDSTFISHTNNAVKLIADNIGGEIEGIVFKNCKFLGGRMAMELQNHGLPLTPPAEGVPKEWYKIRDIEFQNCMFEADSDDENCYALSMSGWGRNARFYQCQFSGRKKGVEIAGFSDVVFQACKLKGTQSFITSNKRPMEKVALRLCELKGSVRMEDCSESGFAWCILNADTGDKPYVEIKKSQRCTLLGCEITSSIHYGVMINESKECTVINCKIANTGSNYSVVRCYKPKSTGNIIRGNTLMMRKPKVGKWYDQKDGASGNVFEGNKQEYIPQKK